LRILHCSDIHLGRRPIGSPGSPYSVARYEDYFKAFENIVNYALSGAVDLFLVSGDLFDRKDINPDTLARTQQMLGRLKEASIDVIAIEGNHDKCFNAGESWLLFLEKTGYLKLLAPFHDGRRYSFPCVETGGVRLFGLGYPGFLVDELLSELAERLEGRNNVVLVHSAPGKNDFIPGLATPEKIEALGEKTLYVAGGHLHARASFPAGEPFFHVPGSPEYWDVWESGEKGFNVFDTLTGEVEFHASSRRERQEFACDVDEGPAVDRLNGFVEGLDIHAGSLVLLTVSVPGDCALYPEKIERRLEEMGALKSFLRVKRRDVPVSLEGFRSMGAREIEREVLTNSREWRELGAKGDSLVRLIDSLKQSQQEGRYEQFKETLDIFLEGLAGESS